MNKSQNKDSLGDRMKTYEQVSQSALCRRTPVIIRLDGKAWHTFTNTINVQKPFDQKLHSSMVELTAHLVDGIQGAVFGYTQSDKISILVVDYKNLNTSAWFDNNIQKMCSVSASMATAAFSRIYKADQMALFDSRVFNLPKEEVCYYFILVFYLV